MQILRLLVVCIGWYNSDTHTAAKGAKAESFSKTSLAQSSNWPSSCNSDIAQVDFAYPTSASFTRPAIPEPCATCSTLCQDGELKAKLVRWQGSESRLVLLPLQADEQKAWRSFASPVEPIGKWQPILGMEEDPKPQEGAKVPANEGRATKSDGKGSKDKGKDKGKDQSRQKGKDAPAEQPFGPLPTPFHYTPTSLVPSIPWPTTDTASPFQAAQNQQAALASTASQELISALKRAYADSTMPQDIKDIVEKHESSGSRQTTKELHAATTQLGRAQKALKEAQQQRQSHRTAWLAHLTESMKLWEGQLEEFKKRQMALREAEQKAAQDNSSARSTIQQLNQKLQWYHPERDGGSLPRRTSGIYADNEEANLRAKLSRPWHNVHQWLGSLRQL